MKVRAKMLYEYAMILKALTFFFSADQDDEMEYLFVIRAVGDGQEADDDWMGKMNETKRAIIAVETNLKKDNATIKAQMDTNNANVNEKFDKIMKKLSE